MKIKKKMRILLIAVTSLIALSLWLIWQNTSLMVTDITVNSERLPSAFDGFRIAHISDLHNAEFGNDNCRLIDSLREIQPDMVVITGDLIDSRCTDVDVSLKAVEQMVPIAPTYYINGNHESRIDEYERLRAGLEEMGVTVLENKRVVLEQNDETITLFGVCDPDFDPDMWTKDGYIIMSEQLEALDVANEDGFSILLSHRPERFSLYVEHGVDLVFSGHAHGGQVRLPWIGGLFAPGQGLFPQYDAGLFRQENTQMIVSRGLGNSLFPFRIGNRPEIVVAELHATSFHDTK